jgi:HlyD family secretion protein
VANPPVTARYLVPGSPVYRGEMALFPGMTASVSILTERKRDVLRVPNLALRFNPGTGNAPKGDKVWVLEAGMVRALPVTVGISGGQYSEVSGPGLREGLTILTGDGGAGAAQTVPAAPLGMAGGPPPPSR